MKNIAILKHPWFVALLLLTLYLATTEFKYGWDDQHLEIPLLKSLIDHSLYKGDYYVESLKKNFSSFFYPILARFITTEQVPDAYFYLFLICRYFMFFWMYKLWLFITKRAYLAFSCLLTFLLVARVEEFLYRTFSHQEFSFAFIFAGIYYFFIGRFLLAAIIFGISANFNAIYALFPFLYMGAYLLFEIKKYKFKTLLKTSIGFIIAAAPFIIWILKNKLSSYNGPQNINYKEWLELALLACPQNFLFLHTPFSVIFKNVQSFIQITGFHLNLILLFVINLCFNETFRKNRKAIWFSLTCFILLIICFIFTEIHPNRLIIDLNITRNSQYLFFLLLCFTTILILENVEKLNPFSGMILILSLALLKFQWFIALYAELVILLTLSLHHLRIKEPKLAQAIKVALGILIGICVFGILYSFKLSHYRPAMYLNLKIILALLCVGAIVINVIKDNSKILFIKKILIFIPFISYMIQFNIYYYDYLQQVKHGTGMWKLQNEWEKMQYYIKYNTPKDALFLIPYDMTMCGFRMFSERKIIVSYRDCGIIGFDYSAVKEWKRRIDDVEPFKVIIKKPIEKAIKNAILKYKANYILFMKYAKPKEDSTILKHVYSDELFSLYKVTINPVK